MFQYWLEASGYGCAHLHGFIIVQGAEKQPIHKGNRAACRRGKVNRRADDKGICRCQLRGDFIHHIVKDAFAGLGTLAAGNAAVNILASHMEQFHFDSFGFQCLFQFGQRRVGAALCTWAAIN